MSGLEKFAFLAVYGAALAAIQAARAVQVVAEEAARARMIEEHHREVFESSRARLITTADEVAARYDRMRSEFPAGGAIEFEARLAHLLEGIHSARSPDVLAHSELGLRSFEADVRTAVMRQAEQLRQQDRARERASAVELGRQLRAELSSFDAQLNALREGGGLKWDAEGRQAALTAVNACRALLDSTEPERREEAHVAAREALQRHAARLRQQSAQHLEREVSARENLTQGEAEIAGLRAHATAVRWASTQIEELATRVESWRTAIAHDASDIASREALNSLQAEVGSLLERVDAAQLKADQRDYIVRSIREALVEMGYVVSDAVAEHPEHPASSLVFTAANAAGQGLSVSVPVEGEVWYDIRGFTLGTETRLDGKAIAVCDSAQDVIEEMHRMLGEQHEVQAGELLWEGKDPDRHLRAVKQLPQPKDDRHERGAS